MQSVLLDAPAGITARLGWDPTVSDHDRKRLLAREIVAARLGVDESTVRLEREAPTNFGFHTQLIAEVGGHDVALAIRNVSFRAATVVAVSDPSVPFGLHLCDAHPDESTVRDMRRHSHLLDEGNLDQLIAHWTRVQAIRDADGRGARVAADHVRLESGLTKGSLLDRPMRYQLVDLSRDAWIITLAYGAQPA